MAKSPRAIWRHVLEFLDAIGFEVTKDVISRVDFQLTFDGLTMSELAELEASDHIVTKTRKGSWHFSGLGSKKSHESLTLADRKAPVRFLFYNKKLEAFGGDVGTVKQALLLGIVGADWVNSDVPMTRFEISIKRDGLRAMGVDGVDDLFGGEWAIINLLLTKWLRILAEPKVKGKEYKQKNHPVWDKIRRLFRLHFPGGSDDDIAEWIPPKPVTCDPVALEKQALGCLAKAQAQRHGVQYDKKASTHLANQWVVRNSEKLYHKANQIALQSHIKTGVPVGEVKLIEGFGDYKNLPDTERNVRRASRSDGDTTPPWLEDVLRDDSEPSQKSLLDSLVPPTLDGVTEREPPTIRGNGSPVELEGNTHKELFYDFMKKSKDFWIKFRE